MDFKAKLKQWAIYATIGLVFAVLGIASPFGDRDVNDAIKILKSVGGSTDAIVSIQKDMETMKKHVAEQEWLNGNSIGIRKYLNYHKRAADEIGIEPSITCNNIVYVLGKNTIEAITLDLQEGGNLLERYFKGSADLPRNRGENEEPIYRDVNRCSECGFDDEEHDEKIELLHLEGESDTWYKTIWMCPECSSYIIEFRFNFR